MVSYVPCLYRPITTVAKRRVRVGSREGKEGNTCYTKPTMYIHENLYNFVFPGRGIRTRGTGWVHVLDVHITFSDRPKCRHKKKKKIPTVALYLVCVARVPRRKRTVDGKKKKAQLLRGSCLGQK